MTDRPTRVLIISYYWPPSGGSGVQRWLKFTKYLPQFGWKPVVLTPENPDFPALDRSLEKDIHPDVELIKTSIWEPYTWYRTVTGKAADQKMGAGFVDENAQPGWMERISRWIRGNVFVPDARCFWIRPATRFALNYLSKHPVDLIISTGPPHSMHLIAQQLKTHFSLPWIADFRDPWVNIDYTDELRMTSSTKKRIQHLEDEVLKNSDHVLVVSPSMQREFKNRTKQISVLYNGFDQTDFGLADFASSPSSNAFILAHVGSLVPARNVPELWSALEQLCQTDAGFASKLRLMFAGVVDAGVREELDRRNLTSHCEFLGYLPHEEIPKVLASASVLLLSVNRSQNASGILTGKVFEYLASNKPILASAPLNGDLAELLSEEEHAFVVGFGDEIKMKARVEALFSDWMNKKPIVRKGAERYTRQKQTEYLSELMNQLIHKPQ